MQEPKGTASDGRAVSHFPGCLLVRVALSIPPPRAAVLATLRCIAYAQLLVLC